MGLFETNETKLQIIFLLIGPQPSIQDCIWVNTSELKHISDKSTWADIWMAELYKHCYVQTDRTEPLGTFAP